MRFGIASRGPLTIRSKAEPHTDVEEVGPRPRHSVIEAWRTLVEDRLVSARYRLIRSCQRGLRGCHVPLAEEEVHVHRIDVECDRVAQLEAVPDAARDPELVGVG